MFRLLLATTMLVLAPGLASAETRALVIGIDSYPMMRSLNGAVNDAEDLNGAFLASGATDVTLMVEGDATKDSIRSAWENMIERSEPGDTLVLTFAGHGGQIGELQAGTESDRLDEFFLLSRFNPDDLRGSLDAMIFDDEIRTWLQAATDKGLKVVFVADACHAGGMTRTLAGKNRFVTIKDDPGFRSAATEYLQSRAPGGGGGGLTEPEPAYDDNDGNPNVTFLAGAPEHQIVPEVMIDGKKRGALSYSVARAFEGYADRDGDGVLMRSELEDYVFETVRTRSDAVQIPVLKPRAVDQDLDVAQLRPVSKPLQTLAVARKQGPTGRYLRAADLGWKPVLPLVVEGSDDRPDDTVAAADGYIWDVANKEFRSPNGEVVAQKVNAFTVDDVVQKFILVDLLTRMQQQNPAKMELDPMKAEYVEGERIAFDGKARRYRNVVVFNLASTGEVQFVDLLLNGKRTGKGWVTEIKVVPPFGADHLVMLATDEPLDVIGEQIRSGISPKALIELITQRLDGRDVSVALQPLYSRKKG